MTAKRLKTMLLALASVAVMAPEAMAAPIPATLYKDPSCDCCQSYANYLDQNGFAVKVVPSPNLDALTEEAGVPTSLVGCHLTKLDGYVIEGHVPAPIVEKFLAEHLPVRGLAIAGMPAGVPGMPGMEGMAAGPIQVFEVGTATPVVFATIPGGEF